MICSREGKGKEDERYSMAHVASLRAEGVRGSHLLFGWVVEGVEVGGVALCEGIGVDALPEENDMTFDYSKCRSKQKNTHFVAPRKAFWGGCITSCSCFMYPRSVQVGAIFKLHV